MCFLKSHVIVSAGETITTVETGNTVKEAQKNKRKKKKKEQKMEEPKDKQGTIKYSKAVIVEF